MLNKIERHSAEKIVRLLKDENQSFKVEFKERNSSEFWFETSNIKPEKEKNIKPYGVEFKVKEFTLNNSVSKKPRTIKFYFKEWYKGSHLDKFHFNIFVNSNKTSELNLDDIIEDDKYYYVVKSYKLSGRGFIKRLIASVKHQDKKLLRELKLKKLELLNSKIGFGILEFENEEKITICKLLKSDLESNKTKFLSDFWNQFLRFCFLVEIIKEE